MNMEELSKSQIILLTLLVSFVTSIATGIVTVSLMEQAPPAVAQTVNRIIERTVEKVVPEGQAAATVVTQEKTVVVKESELISKAVETVEKSVVRIYSRGTDPAFLGIGIVTDSSGTVVSDKAILGENVTTVVIERADKKNVSASLTPNESLVGTGLATFTVATSTTEGESVTWTPVAIASGGGMLGETVVSLAGKTVTRIAAGIITALDAATESSPTIVDTDIDATSILAGSPLIDSDGSLLGISTGIARATSMSGFISASILVKKPAPEPQEE